MSENMQKTDLFKDFSPVTPEDWQNQILHDLKAATDTEKRILYQTQLIKKNIEGITLEPFYTGRDLPLASAGPLRSTTEWVNREEVVVNDVNKANVQAKEALSGGAEAILFDITLFSSIDWNQLLQQINAEQIPISFRINDPGTLKALKNQLSSRWSGSLEYVVPNQVPDDEAYKDLSSLSKPFTGNSTFRTITITGHLFHNAGASAVQELAFTLATFVEYLDGLTEQGVTAADILRATEFSLSVDTTYFLQIAKLRALRLLVEQVGKAYQVENPSIFVHARTATWNKFRQDAYNNMLRATLEAMAAVLGGCDALTVAPYNTQFTEDDPFARRIARNVSTILKGESFLNKVADPAAGAYFIENLSYSLAKDAWALFQTVEQKGGFKAAWKQKFVQTEIEKVRTAKEDAIQAGRQTLVGINKYVPQRSSPLTDAVFEGLQYK